MAATRTKVELENLPPTESATYYHALRVHLQVAQWKHLDLTCLNPLDWGQTLQNNYVAPVKTDLLAAPDWLLQVVRCKCKTTTKPACSTLIYSCRKNGFTCVAACGNCLVATVACGNCLQQNFTWWRYHFFSGIFLLKSNLTKVEVSLASFLISCHHIVLSKLKPGDIQKVYSFKFFEFLTPCLL